MSTTNSARRQKVINDLAQEIGRNLATKTVLFHSALAAKLGLSATDLKCLDLLRYVPEPMTATDLVERTGLTGGAITGVIDRLENGGFVERVRDSEDRRRWELHPIGGSRQVVLDLFVPIRGAMSQLCSKYGDDQLDVISQFLTELGSVLDAAALELRA